MCAKKLDNPEERNKFLETYNLARLNQEETDNLNRLISSGEIEKVKTKRKTNNNNKKQFPANTSPNSHNFTGKFKQPYKELIHISYLGEKKKKLKRQEHFQIHSMKPTLPRYQAKQEHTK